MSPEQYKKIQRRLSAITDIIPVVEGNFTFRLLLRNTESKEFSSFEENIVSLSSEGPGLSSILFLYNEKPIAQLAQTVPFGIHDHQLFPNSQKTYVPGEDLLFYIEIYNPSEGFKTCNLSLWITQNEQVITSLTEGVGIQTYFLKRVALKDSKPGFYKLKVALLDSTGKEVLSRESEFNISALANIPRPWNYGKIYPPLDHPYFALIRAYQYLSLGLKDKVIREIEKFYVPSQPQKEIATALASAHFAKNEYSKVIEVLDPLKGVQDLEIYRLLGRAYLETSNYAKAVEFFAKALITGGDIVEILNLLGYSYFRLNDSDNALKYLERSLKIKADQPNIRELVEKIRK